MDRRRFLQGLAFAAFAGGSAPGAHALGSRDQLRITRLRHDGHWDVHDGAGEVLAREIHYRTSIDVDREEEALTPTDERFAERPFALLAGDAGFALSDAGRQRLKRWLELGGFLLVDNNGRTGPSEDFDRSVRRELERILPGRELGKVSPDHVIYRSFYRLDYPAGRAIHRSYVEGLELGRRYAVIVNHNDLLGACARNESGDYRMTPTPGGRSQREMAFRFGVNLVLYAQCLHYKDDQVHLDYLLHRRDWKIERPD